jgi:hypothetical protein
MTTFHDRVFVALAQFNGRLSAFTELVSSKPADPPRVSRKALDELLASAARARAASDAIARSITLIEGTSLDIVDMQVRLQGQTARLASALRELGERVERQPAIRDAFSDALVALDEASQLVAAAVFPSSVQGLRSVNVKLWDFEKLQWKRYTDILSAVVRSGRITSEQQVKIQSIADDVARAFADVNNLLNELAESREADGPSLRKRLDAAPAKLTSALQQADARMTPAFSMFAPVIKASRKVAEDVAKLLRKLTVPLFPAHERLGDCSAFIDRPLYDSLSGVQTFALLNILARIQATRASGRPLLTGRSVRVTHVFPDRIYFEADRSLVADMAADPAFEEAPASLHRFKEGSFKQRSFRRGNLQVCFASRAGDRIVVDADIDLYRAAVPHLFGEVLVNHLTGNPTDQYGVRKILDDQSVVPIGGFQLFTV